MKYRKWSSGCRGWSSCGGRVILVTDSSYTKLRSSDAETKKLSTVNTITVSAPSVWQILIERCSTWTKRQRSLGWLLRYKAYCLRKYKGLKVSGLSTGELTMSKLRLANKTIVQHVQANAFPDEFQHTKPKDPTDVSHKFTRKKLSSILQVDALNWQYAIPGCLSLQIKSDK